MFSLLPCFFSFSSLPFSVAALLLRFLFSTILYLVTTLHVPLLFSPFLCWSFLLLPSFLVSLFSPLNVELFFLSSILSFSLLPVFLPCASDFFLLAACKRNGSLTTCSLLGWLVARIPVSCAPLPAAAKRRAAELNALEF